MTWHQGRPRLKLTGHRSAEEVDAIFASCLVDVAYVVDTTPTAVFVVADDPAWPTDPADYEWLCSIIRETLADHKMNRIEFVLCTRDVSVDKILQRTQPIEKASRWMCVDRQASAWRRAHLETLMTGRILSFLRTAGCH